MPDDIGLDDIHGTGRRMRAVVDRLRDDLPTSALWIAVVATSYVLAGLAGLELAALVREQVSPIWPPTGIALFFLFKIGYRAVPGVMLGAVLVNAPLGPNAWAVALITLGNTLAPLTAYLLLRRADFRPGLNRLSDALALITLGGFAAMAVSATLGTSALLLAGEVELNAAVATWLVWWTGDAMGVLIICPLLLLVYADKPTWLRSPARWLEAVALLVFTTLITLGMTSGNPDLLFPSFLPLIWAAVRFQLLGAAPCALIISLITTLAATSMSGPFNGYDLAVSMIVLQIFNASTALIALLLSATINQRNHAQAAVEETCLVLADAVKKLGGTGPVGERTLAAVRRATHGDRSDDGDDRTGSAPPASF